MRNLFQFISKNHVLLLFIVLELVAFLMIVQNNSFQRTAFLNSTNGLTSNIFRTITTWQDYWSLKKHQSSTHTRKRYIKNAHFYVRNE